MCRIEALRRLMVLELRVEVWLAEAEANAGWLAILSRGNH